MLAPSTPPSLFVLTEPACPKAHGNQTPAVTSLIHSLASCSVACIDCRVSRVQITFSMHMICLNPFLINLECNLGKDKEKYTTYLSYAYIHVCFLIIKFKNKKN